MSLVICCKEKHFFRFVFSFFLSFFVKYNFFIRIDNVLIWTFRRKMYNRNVESSQFYCPRRCICVAGSLCKTYALLEKCLRILRRLLCIDASRDRIQKYLPCKSRYFPSGENELIICRFLFLFACRTNYRPHAWQWLSWDHFRWVVRCSNGNFSIKISSNKIVCLPSSMLCRPRCDSKRSIHVYYRAIRNTLAF